MSCDVPVAAVAYVDLAVMIQILYVVEITAVLIFYESLAMWQIENAKWLSDYLINHIVVAAVLSRSVQGPDGGDIRRGHAHSLVLSTQRD